MSDIFSKEAIVRLRKLVDGYSFPEWLAISKEEARAILALLAERERIEELERERDAIKARADDREAARVEADRIACAGFVKQAELRRENAALRDVAEKFRAWTETPPNTQEESDALHEATEALGALGAFDATRTRAE